MFLNLHAYCANNPLMYIDSSGHFAVLNLKTLRSLSDKLLKITEDIRNFDIRNTDENVALKSNYFSFYKGSLVIRHSLPGTSCGIFNTIFLNTNETKTNTVKHEWGHNQQERELGTFMYIFRVVIPSLDGYFNRVYDYYSQPWEYSADILGGVNRGSYSISEDDAMRYIFIDKSSNPYIVPNPLIPWP